MKGIYKKRILKITALLIVMVLIAFICESLLIRTTSAAEAHIKNFYREPKNSLDVAVIGCSEMYADYSPPIAYRNFGFTSYNLAVEGVPGHFFNSMLDEFLSRQDPQLVVFEVNGFFYTEKHLALEGSSRKWLDNMERNANWAEQIHDNIDKEDQFDYYVRLSKYHSNWERPEGQLARVYNMYLNYKGKVSKMKSFGTRTSCNSKKKVNRKKPPQLTDYGREYLQATIDHCRELGLENVLFIREPHKAKISAETDAELEKMITDGGYKYFNLEAVSDEIGIDESTDYYNGDHLNVFGNEKATLYLGKYIMENYDISTEHTEEINKLWDDCADYTEEAFSILKERTLANEDKVYSEFNDLSEKGSALREKYHKIKKQGKDENFDEHEPPEFGDGEDFPTECEDKAPDKKE